VNTGKYLDQGRLPGAIVPEETHHLAGIEMSSSAMTEPKYFETPWASISGVESLISVPPMLSFERSY
jgi:hypothetical protein